MKRRAWRIAYFLTTIGYTCGLIFIPVNLDTAQAIATDISTTTTACPSTDFYINVPADTFISNTVYLNLNKGSESTATIQRVIFFIDEAVLGEARPSTPNSINSWGMPWDTRFHANNEYYVNAQVFFNGLSQCTTNPRLYKIGNSTVTSLDFNLALQPTQINIPANTFVDISATIAASNLTTVNILEHAVFEWSTTIGVIKPQGKNALFHGATAGRGEVKAVIRYAGISKDATIDATIDSYYTTTTTTTSSIPSGTTAIIQNNSTTETGTATDMSSQEQLSPISLQQQIESQPEIKNCAAGTLGDERISKLSIQEERLNSEEFNRIVNCFANRSYVIPSAYVPIAPLDVKEKIGQSRAVQIQNAAKITGDTDVTKSYIKFEGKTLPDSNVYLYVFSEPLVLYTKSDSKGNWSYNIVDPLLPGNHEAYAVVETSNGVYERSSPFSFLIGKAAATDENPNGYSFEIETIASISSPAAERSTNIFIYASVTIIVLVVGMGGLYLKKLLGKIPQDESENESDNTTPQS